MGRQGGQGGDRVRFSRVLRAKRGLRSPFLPRWEPWKSVGKGGQDLTWVLTAPSGGFFWGDKVQGFRKGGQGTMCGVGWCLCWSG